MSVRSSRAIAAALILVLPILFFHQTALNGMIMARGDVYTYFYPYWAARSAAFLDGRFPLWEPNIFMGVPFFANSQAGVLYPPNWLVTPLTIPAAVTLSIVGHAAWAMLGMTLLARRTLKLDRTPALLAGALFAYGGYLGAQVEHINQFQALAWMPWLFLAYQGMRRRPLFAGLLLAGALALQLLAGHPQTVFISLVGLGVYALTVPLPVGRPSGLAGWLRGRIGALLRLALPVGLALLLAAPQLIPTLELSRESQRSGGLGAQAAMSFSFNPFLVGRGLLPSYDALIFTEYIGYGGVIGFGLAAFGVLAWLNGLRRKSSPASPIPAQGWGSPLTPFVALLLVGLVLAFGAYNPLYWLLANLPGFGFFRVPARWLALAALAVAALAGMGLQSLRIQQPSRRALAITAAFLLALAAAAFLADRAAEDITGPALPTVRTVLAWGAALAVLAVGVGLAGRPTLRARVLPLLALAAGVELFAAAHTLAYNQIVPPDVYAAPRFTLNQLRAQTLNQTPPGRYLGISPLEFDPGDVDRLTLRYQALDLSEIAIRTALVATKMREIAAPNLPLVWNIPSIDGFDGGLLPTDAYAAFSRLLLPPDADSALDGRLRERLALPECRGICLPEQRWLNLTGTRYLVVDKTGDLWHEDVAYDMALPQPLLIGQTVTVLTGDPPFQSTAIDLLLSTAAAPVVRAVLDDGTAVDLEAEDAAAVDAFWRVRYRLPQAGTPVQVDIQSDEAQTMQALTLVDTRTGDFLQSTLGPWRRVLSSDIKLYENLTVLPRAFVVPEAVGAADEAAALAVLRDPAFDPAQTLVLTSGDTSNRGGEGTVTIANYTPEQIDLTVSAPRGGWLLLTDAYFPGWQATVNDQPSAILRANLVFRALRLPEGDSRVSFRYQPAWWPGALVGGAAGWLLWGAGVLLAGWRRKDYTAEQSGIS